MKTSILFISLVLLSGCLQNKKIQKLSLVKSYEVKTNGQFEPSGLTLWDGDFYTVSDKHDAIYQLTFNDKYIDLKPIIKIRNDRNTKLDFEGISHDDNYFYLISEMYFQILRVSKDGKQQKWLPKNTNFKKLGQKVGLFNTTNAYFESICLLKNTTFLMAAERNPRGFVEVDLDKDNKLTNSKAYQLNETIFLIDESRSTDFTGLSCDNNDVYVLERNSYTIAKLKKRKGKYQEKKGWNYQSIIMQDDFLYQDMRYGQAEGLVVKGKKFYIILDNNRNPHLIDNSNNNSLFLEMSY